jgi:ribosomal subunit interface protein
MKCEVSGRNFEVDDKMRAYASDKIGSLEKYLPRQVRAVTTCTVILEDDPNGREDNRYVCEAVLNAPGAQMVSREGTINIYAAVDIAEAKLKAQLAKYKEKHALEPRRARMLTQWLGRRSPGEQPAGEDSTPE